MRDLLTRPTAPPLSAWLTVQRKVEVGAVSDPREHEADRIADEVMRGARTTRPTVGGGSPPIQRSCTSCGKPTPDEEQDKPACTGCGVQRKATSPEAPVDSAFVARVSRMHADGGRPLPGETLAVMSQRFGYDLSGVRVHDDAAAADASRAVSAKAFTLGNHIAFNRGMFAPHTESGQRLIAHELAHVLQQDRAGQIRRSPLPESAGEALPVQERAFFETRYGRDLSRVRVHADGASAQLANEYGAAAYTFADRIVFGAGRYQPGTPAGRELLAHELAHVAQHEGAARTAGALTVSQPGDASEIAAEQASERALEGKTASIAPWRGPPKIHRVIPGPKPKAPEPVRGNPMKVVVWRTQILVLRAQFTAPRYAPVRVGLLRALDVLDAYVDAYDTGGAVKLPAAPLPVQVAPLPVALFGVPPVPVVPPLVGATPAPNIPVGPVTPLAPPSPVSAPVPLGPQAPVGTPGPGAGGGGMGAGPAALIGVAIVIGAAVAGYVINKALQPSEPTNLAEVEALWMKFQIDRLVAEAIVAQREALNKAKPKAKATAKTSEDKATDVVAEPKDDDPKSCDPKDTSCKPVPIPRKGGTAPATLHHNMCADGVTLPIFRGKDLCVNGKAFDALDATGTLWEVKAHQWVGDGSESGKKPFYQKPFGQNIELARLKDEITKEKDIAEHCKFKFKVGVRQQEMVDALKGVLSGVDIVKVEC